MTGRLCEIIDCIGRTGKRKRAAFGTPGKAPKRCKEHALPGMKDVVNPRCEHGRQTSTGRSCQGSQICVHGKHKSTCLEGTCQGSQRCEHGRIKAMCKETPCQGSQICAHGRQKSRCREGNCRGASFCEHGRLKIQCNEGHCHGSQMCEHGGRRAFCTKGNCTGPLLCEHGRQPSFCKEGECCGSQIVCTTGSSRHVKTVVEGAFASTADERHNVVKVPVVVNKYAPQRDVVHEYIISHQKRSFASYILWRLFRTLLW